MIILHSQSLTIARGHCSRKVESKAIAGRFQDLDAPDTKKGAPQKGALALFPPPRPYSSSSSCSTAFCKSSLLTSFSVTDAFSKMWSTTLSSNNGAWIC